MWNGEENELESRLRMEAAIAIGSENYLIKKAVQKLLKIPTYKLAQNI